MIKKLKIETDFECTNSFRPSFLFRLSYNLVQAQAFLKFTASIDDDNTPLFEFVKDRLRLIRLYISFYAIIALLLCLLVLFDMNLLL